MATASRRSSRSSNSERISASVEGINMAPKIPMPARPAINCSALAEYAVTTDTVAKPNDPISNNLR
ncbi:hypothetical protein D3C77_686910 [compost metagenome]